jgi:ubiquinone/menaquinone biosynthesis C-methylase UbiE
METGTDPRLQDFFRTGKPIEIEKTMEASIATTAGTQSVYMVFLYMIFPVYVQLRQQLENGSSFLDIGCGSGNLIIELAHIFKQSLFYGTDPDLHAIERARTAISHFGLDRRVIVEDMAAENLSFQNEFDLASLVITLHEIPPHLRTRVAEKAYLALKEGGQILILDFPYPENLEDFRNPVYSHGIIEQYFEAADGTVNLTASEQNELLTNAGFKDIQRMMIGDGMFEFVVAKK